MDTPIARAKIWTGRVLPNRGASHKTEAIITMFMITAPVAGTKKWPRAFRMPMNIAVKQITSMYGNITRSSRSISSVSTRWSEISRL